MYASNFHGTFDGTADKATKDASGNTITSTYETKANAITGLSYSGSTLTYTKGDGTSDTLTITSGSTYTEGTGISISSNVISNSGVRSITTGSSNGTISVNTGGTTTNVSVYGLGSNAYTSTAYLPLSAGTGYPVTGTIYATKTSVAYGSSNNYPAIIAGGTVLSTHMEIDKNQIIAKATSSTAAILYLGWSTTDTVVRGPLSVTGTTVSLGNGTTEKKASMVYDDTNKAIRFSFAS